MRKGVKARIVCIVCLLTALIAVAGWPQPGSEQGMDDNTPTGQDPQNAESQQGRFMFDIGLGAAQAYYGADAEVYFSAAEAMGLDRIEVALDLAAGWLLVRNVYGVGCISGFATRFSDIYGSYLQLNSYLYGGGLRVYPFKTRLMLGFDAGVARIVIMSNLGISGISPSGWGVAGTIGYDFNPKPTGMSVVVGLRANYDFIGSATSSAVSIFADLLWK